MRDASRAVVLVAVALIAGISLIAGIAASAGATAGADAADRPRRLDDVRLLGTHNSYHLRPDRAITPGEPADYAHAPLDVQLSDQGVRSLEIDAFDAPNFPVFHSLLVDTRSTCTTLERCFGAIATWSDAHPHHDPIVVFFEPKRLPTNTNPSVQAAIDAAAAEQGITGWDAAGLERVDALAHDVFGDSLLTPDDVRGKRRTLRDAVAHDGWPTLARSRGKVLVTLIGDQIERDLYREGAPSLEGRAMFVDSRPRDPSAAVLTYDVPDATLIRPLVRRHFLVKTRADANGVEARANDHTRADRARRSGAQIVVTDYPVPDATIGPYVVERRDLGR